MIPVVCHTNIDSFRHVQWPTELLGIPNKGDYIQALAPAVISVKRGNGMIEKVEFKTPMLQVVGVTHVTNDPRIRAPGYILVELHHEHAHELGWIH